MFDTLGETITTLNPPCSLDAVHKLVALHGQFEAIIANLVGQVDAAGLYGNDDCVSMSSWLRHQCDLTKNQAGALVSLGRSHRQFPVMGAAARDGSVTAGQVSVITTVIKSHLTELFAEHEADIIPAIIGMNIPHTAAVVKHWAAHADALTDTPEPDMPQGAVRLSSTFDGTWQLSGTLSDEAGIPLRAALDVAMPAVDDRTPSARQHDALVAIARFYLDHHRQPSAPRRRPHVNLIINVDDLDTMRNTTTVDGATLNARSTSSLLCDSVLHRVVTDRSGAILNIGRAQRTVTAPIWAALAIRDRHCRFPRCDRPAQACDAHHVIHWGHGGPTSLDNLVLFCSTHHHICHTKGYTVKLLPDGTVEITKPDGTTTTSHPPNHSPPQLHFH
jgi:hypothetical protein